MIALLKRLDAWWARYCAKPASDHLPDFLPRAERIWDCCDHCLEDDCALVGPHRTPCPGCQVTP